MPLKFSIITCTWNSADYLEACLSSILAQNYPHIELILVDGGSTDGTLDSIRALPRPYRLIENIRGGISHAMNEGIRLATGDVIAHLHSDDYYLMPGVLSKVAQHFQSSGRGWVFGRIMQDRQGDLHGEDFIAPRYSYAQLLKRNFIPHPATFVQRDLMLRAQGFNPALKYAMDYDLWLKLARLGNPVQLDEPLTAFRVHSGSLSTRNRLAAMEEDFQVRRSHIGKNPVIKTLHHARYLWRRQRALYAGAQA